MPNKNLDIPIFEQGTKAQKADKPKIEDVCDYFLKDNTLRDGMARLLEISRELRMKPCWIQINGYKCSYKGKGVVSYIIGGNDFIKDFLIVSVSLADREDLEKVVLSLPDNEIKEFLNREITHCRVCSAATCSYGGVALEIAGEKYHTCSRFNYMCKNPTLEQFKMIERFIKIRRNYIDEKMK